MTRFLDIKKINPYFVVLILFIIIGVGVFTLLEIELDERWRYPLVGLVGFILLVVSYFSFVKGRLK